jgi:TetR/AcrR family transcriptional regulator, cholesterol catabolism regulator
MMNEQQEKWLRRVEELFLRFGIKSITMDDVARELGVSKKTLYQFVESKDDLVQLVVQRHIEVEKAECHALYARAKNAVEELLLVIENTSQQLSQMKQNIVYDMQKYHRAAWDLMQDYQQKFMYGVVRKNLERGIQEGLYRNDFDPDILTRLHIMSSFQLFDESVFPTSQYSREKIFEEYLLHYLHGILSDKGRKKLQQYQQTDAPASTQIHTRLVPPKIV